MLRLRPTPAGVLSCLALAIALGGSAFAATGAIAPKNSVGSPQVVNGSLQKVDLSGKAIAGLHGARGATGARGPTGPQGTQGQQGPKGDTGAAGPPGTARAYGAVSLAGTVTRSKNVVSVTNPLAGDFCITVAPSIDPATTGVLVSPDYAEDFTGYLPNDREAIIEFDSDAADCPAGSLEVVTGYRQPTSSGSLDGDIHTEDNVPANQGFFFVVP